MSYLGKYTQMPAAFEKLLVLEKELESNGYSLDRELSFIPQSDFFAYDVTRLMLLLLRVPDAMEFILAF